MLPHAILGQVTLLWLPFDSSEVLPWCGLWSPHSHETPAPLGPTVLGWWPPVPPAVSLVGGTVSFLLCPPAQLRWCAACQLNITGDWGQLRHHPEVDSATYPEGHPTQAQSPSRSPTWPSMGLLGPRAPHKHPPPSCETPWRLCTLSLRPHKPQGEKSYFS